MELLSHLHALQAMPLDRSLDLASARLQMALSLGFHIVFAAIGVAMPFLMAASHWRWLRHRSEADYILTKAWSKGVAIFFATGAVSGTVLSFELGLLWPTFMRHAGPIIGMPFSWEGTAFFMEAILIGLFLYGWDRLTPWVHWLCGLGVGIFGVASALFVICANGWMNTPVGFRWTGTEAVDIDPTAAMFNPAALWQGVHMCIAAFQATGFAVAGLHGALLLRDRRNGVHRTALKIALAFGAGASLIQPLAGDLLAKDVAIRQPTKLAAMESLFETQRRAPLVIGGIPDTEARVVRYGIEIPRLLSFLAHSDFDAEVEGLDGTPRELWPPVPVVHFAFQIMVGLGSIMALVALWYLWLLKKGGERLYAPLFLKTVALLTPAGFLAIEAGWTVTEVGRQPWVIYKVMKTADALTPMPGLVYSLVFFASLYIFLSLMCAWLLARQIRALPLVEAR